MQVLRKEKNDSAKPSANRRAGVKSVKNKSRSDKRPNMGLFARISLIFKRVIRVALSLILIAALSYVSWFFYSGSAGRKLDIFINDSSKRFSNVMAQNGMILRDVTINGHKFTKDIDVYGAIKVSAGSPIFDIDPYELREKIKALPWVVDAMVVRKMPDQLHIKIVEYIPFAIWLDGNGQSFVVTSDGHIIVKADEVRKDLYKEILELPKIKGKNAYLYASKIIKELEKFKVLKSMITAYEFIDERRWNLVFGKVVVKLPEIGYEKAIGELNIINKKRNIKEMRVKVIDMRNADKVLFYLEKGASTKFFKKNSLAQSA